MLELKYDNKVHLDKWDIDVVPYLTIENMELHLYPIYQDELCCHI